MKKPQRKYTGVVQYFHNYEHSPTGQAHCESRGKHPYTIKHIPGGHAISNQIAKGHGLGNKPQWFYFPNKVKGGYDLASGIKIDSPRKPKTIKPEKK